MVDVRGLFLENHESVKKHLKKIFHKKTGKLLKGVLK